MHSLRILIKMIVCRRTGPDRERAESLGCAGPLADRHQEVSAEAGLRGGTGGEAGVQAISLDNGLQRMQAECLAGECFEVGMKPQELNKRSMCSSEVMQEKNPDSTAVDVVLESVSGALAERAIGSSLKSMSCAPAIQPRACDRVPKKRRQLRSMNGHTPVCTSHGCSNRNTVLEIGAPTRRPSASEKMCIDKSIHIYMYRY